MSDLRVPRILAPVDLGHSSEAALRCAQMLVSRLGAELTVLYANDALTLQSYDQIYTGNRDLPEEQQELMEDAVRAFATPFLGDTKYDVLVVADDTVRAITMGAERRDADLILLGTHARHGWHRWVEGSVAESVMHATDRPTFTIPQCVEKHDVSAVLCPVNFTPHARHAIKAACRLADRLEAQLHVVHVASEKSRADLAGLRTAIREWIDPQAEQRCEFRQIVRRSGMAAGPILECCNEIGADLIVVGGRGTTVEHLVRGSTVPLMRVVRPWLEEVRAAA